MLDFCIKVYQLTGFTEQGNSFICSTNHNLTNNFLFRIMNHSTKDGQVVNFVDIHRTSGSPGNGNFLKIGINTECSKPHTQHAAVLYRLLKTSVHNMKLLFSHDLHIVSITNRCQFRLDLLYRLTTVVVATTQRLSERPIQTQRLFDCLV